MIVLVLLLLLVLFGIVPLPIVAFLFFTLLFGVGAWMAVLPAGF
jgi:hypothetical protein